MGIVVEEAVSRTAMRQFIRLPPSLYADHPCFVPHLLLERKRFFSPANPIFEFTDASYFLARDDGGEAVGRISAHVNHRHNEFAGEKAGFFGFFDSVDDFDVAAALFAAVEHRLRQKGMSVVRGPFNFSTNEECGLLADGFDKPPFIMMPYTKPLYLDFLPRLGYSKVKELIAYYYAYQGEIPRYLVRFAERIEKRGGVSVRVIDKHNFQQDIERAFAVYNRAWSENWGFIPMTQDQFLYMARELKSIVDPAVALIAEVDGQPVGLSLALPDYNPILKKMKGRLLPFGILHLLIGRRRIRSIRVVMMGVVREHRKRGIDMLLAYYMFLKGLKRGYRHAEFSWILEDNVLFRRAMDRLGAVPYKTYHIYEKGL